mgnify:CR=1 FL=1
MGAGRGGYGRGYDWMFIIKTDVMKDINQTNSNTDSLLDFLSRAESTDYSHLQVFLSRCKNNNCLPQDFLYVCKPSFGKVGVHDIDYRDGCVTIDISDCHTGLSGTLCVDVNSRPDFVMIKWQDIVDMVRESSCFGSGCDELLEFEF